MLLVCYFYKKLFFPAKMPIKKKILFTYRANFVPLHPYFSQ